MVCGGWWVVGGGWWVKIHRGVGQKVIFHSEGGGELRQKVILHDMGGSKGQVKKNSFF